MKFKILNKVFGSGSAPARDRFAFLALVKDIESFPKTDSLGVLLLDDIKMKENCGMMQVYLTASTQEYSYETVGESDSKSFKVRFIGSHPGTEQQALEFATNFTEEEFVVLIPQCNKGIKVLGSPDSPLIFTSSHKSVKDSEKFNFVFEQEIGSEQIYMLYDGIITLNTNIDIDMKDLLELLKGYIKIDGSNLTDAQKQNLRTILGVGGGNLGTEDLSLNENRSFNLKTFFFNFFSNVGLAKVGINKSNPTQALEVVGNIKTDGLIIAEGGTPAEVGSIKRNGNEIQFMTSSGWESIMLKGNYVSDSHGVISPDTPEPLDGWKIGWYTPKVSSADPGTNYPNQDDLKSVEGFFTEFYFDGSIWEEISKKMPSVNIANSFDRINNSEAITAKLTADYIGDFPLQSNDGESFVNLLPVAWINGKFMNPSNGINDHINTRYTVVDIEAGEVVAVKMAFVNQGPTLVFVNESGVAYDLAGITDGNPILATSKVFNVKGKLYINQNLDATTVTYINKYTTQNLSANLVDYVDNKFKVNTDSVLIAVQLLLGDDGYFFNMNTSVVGQTHYSANYYAFANGAMSRLIKVKKDEVYYFTGHIGWNGIGLFDVEGFLSEKILWSNDGADVVDYKISISADGFMYIGVDKTKTNLLKKAATSSEITIQQLYDGVGKQTVEITKEKFICLPKPNNVWVLNVTGILPTTAEEKNTLECSFSDGGRDFLKTKIKVSLQGQSSLQYPKKNFTFDLQNSNDEALQLKIGGFIASDSWHLKGFLKDVSMVRDNLTSNLWHKIRKSAPFPSCLLAGLPNNISSSASDLNYFEEDARFFADGFPVEMYVNGMFQGLYVFRLKKSRQNYKLDNKLKTNIMLEFDYMIDIANGVRLLDWQTFSPKQFELKSPKITGYEVGGIISDTTVMSSINSFWSWTSGIYNNTVTNDNSVDLTAWIDYLIACEVADHWDGFSNNIIIISHDGIKFSPFIYDTDHTWGIWNGVDAVAKSTKTSFILGAGARGSAEDSTFWQNFRTKYLVQIKVRYTDLRKSGIISVQNVDSIATEFIKPYGNEHFKKEFAKWGYGFTPSIGKASLRQILQMANASITYLDGQWLNP